MTLQILGLAMHGLFQIKLYCKKNRVSPGDVGVKITHTHFLHRFNTNISTLLNYTVGTGVILF